MPKTWTRPELLADELKRTLRLASEGCLRLIRELESDGRRPQLDHMTAEALSHRFTEVILNLGALCSAEKFKWAPDAPTKEDQ